MMEYIAYYRRILFFYLQMNYMKFSFFLYEVGLPF